VRRNAEESAANDPNEYVYKAPQGGLILHWFMSVVVIAGSSSIRELSESVGLPGYVQTYVHCFVLSEFNFFFTLNIGIPTSFRVG
jgi:hypothetical protein